MAMRGPWARMTMRAPMEGQRGPVVGERNGTFELEVDKEGNIIDALAALGQLGEDQEASPSLTRFSQSHTLEDGSQRLEVAFGHATGAQDADGANPSVCEEDVRDDDADGEDPLCDVEVDLWLHLARPLVEGEQVDGGKGISGVDGARDDDENPQPDVREGRKARSGLEVGECLAESAQARAGTEGGRGTMKSHFCSSVTVMAFSRSPQQPMVGGAN